MKGRIKLATPQRIRTVVIQTLAQLEVQPDSLRRPALQGLAQCPFRSGLRQPPVNAALSGSSRAIHSPQPTSASGRVRVFEPRA